ncbi:MAG: DNA cytosine methyltransferase [Anaerovoracaceae bacterium]
MNVIDLFCGCGGFSKGFEQAGFNIVYGIDNWKDATITYKHNFPSAVVSNTDINDINGKDILKATGLSPTDIDVIIGGPPCQGFSLSGKRMMDDPRNRLYKAFVDIVAELLPPVFVMENVPGLVRLFDGKVKDAVISDFTELGYNVEMKLLSSDNFGVPQQRKRVFFVGINYSKIKNTANFVFPMSTFGNGTNQPAITCKEAISDLDFIPDDRIVGECVDYQIDAQCQYQKSMRQNSSKVLNHTATLHTEKTKNIIAMVPNGGNYKDLPQELWSTRKVNIAWTRMNSNRPCFTIDTGHNHHFHYKENRVPTVRESARIQSFPDNFEFIGIKTSQLRQVGNAVPPLLSQAIAEKIKEVIRKG